jgi:hypothetical protein
VSACKDNRQSLKEAAKRQAEWAAVLADVAMGFLAPGLAKSLAGRIILNNPSEGARSQLSRLILNTDLTKAAFQGATKVGGQFVKDNSLLFMGDTEVDVFVRNLEAVFQTAFQKVSDELPERDDEELAAIALVYDSSVANVFEYSKVIRDLISKFESQVLRIGGRDTLVAPAGRVYWVVWPDGRKGLALLGKKYGIMGEFLGYWLMTGISPELKDMAMKRSLEVYGTIDTVKREEVTGFPPGW